MLLVTSPNHLSVIKFVNLIINASISEPPTETEYFRQVTYFARKSFDMQCLVEVERALKDAYYKFLLSQHLMDYIDQLVIPEEHISGLRLSNERSDPPAVQVESITMNNYLEVITLIKASVAPRDF